MDTQTILKDFDDTFSALEDAINLFKEEDFNEVPFENSWTPSQVAQHLILANGNFAAVLKGSTKETSRAIDQHIANLAALFLNFEIKLKSPDFILPSNEPHSKQEQLSSIKRIKIDCHNAIEELDLSKTCLDFELPTFGFLTRLEAIYFVIFHTKRHTNQLKKIDDFLKIS